MHIFSCLVPGPHTPPLACDLSVPVASHTAVDRLLHLVKEVQVWICCLGVAMTCEVEQGVAVQKVKGSAQTKGSCQGVRLQ